MDNSFLDGLKHRIASAAALLRRITETARTRAILPMLDDRLLADIGVSRSEALQEAARPLWDLEHSCRPAFPAAMDAVRSAALPRSCNG